MCFVAIDLLWFYNQFGDDVCSSYQYQSSLALGMIATIHVKHIWGIWYESESMKSQQKLINLEPVVQFLG